MSKREQIELLNMATDRLGKLDLKDRHRVLVALLAWHVMRAPENMKGKVLTLMGEQAFDLLKMAEKRVSNETSDLRH